MLPALKELLATKYWRVGSYLLSFGLVTVIAYFTYFHNYNYPSDFFWDEQYHIPSAQKYLNGIFFMEPHPPLGKLLIALGEKLLHANAAYDRYKDTDFAGNVPMTAGLSFVGYRFFPVLLAWLTAPVIFAIFLLLADSQLMALLFSSLYLFDNALIVHQRGAMLEGILLFFTTGAILAFLLVLRSRDRPWWFSAFSVLFGIFFALSVTTKVTGMILLLLVPAVLWQTWRNWKQSVAFLGLSLIPFAVVFAAVWQIHFSLAAQINPALPNNGYFDVSEEYRQVLDAKATNDPAVFPMMLRESLAYIPHYNANVPKLNMCDLKDGGSPAFLWPLGSRTINYRWESPDGFVYRYLYLQSNPIGWAVGALGALLTTGFLLTSLFVPLQEKLQRGFLMTVFLVMYLGYMYVMLNIQRTMYLYHYFPPLILSFIMFALAFGELRQFARWVLTPKTKTIILAIVMLGVFLSFQFYRPFTYYEPITDVGFRRRALFPLWQLRCINCEPNKFLWEAIERPAS